VHVSAKSQRFERHSQRPIDYTKWKQQLEQLTNCSSALFEELSITEMVLSPVFPSQGQPLFFSSSSSSFPFQNEARGGPAVERKKPTPHHKSRRRKKKR